jgi:two-component system sensor histidine kinase VicK
MMLRPNLRLFWDGRRTHTYSKHATLYSSEYYEMIQPENNTAAEITRIFYGSENVVRKVLQIISNTRSKLDACIDHTRPLLVIELDAIKNSIVEAKRRGVKTRFITEIIKENVSYCKELVMLTDEVRHLDGIKGSFWLNETEYIAPATLHKKGRAASEIIYSNVSELVEHQQYLFDTLWNKSLPAEEKIREINEGIVSANLQVLQSPQEGIKCAWNMVRKAREDVFVMFSTSNAFRRQVQMGILQLFHEVTNQNPSIKIKILIPTDRQITETVKKAKLESPQVDFRIYEQGLKGMGFFLVDKKECLIIETRDDTKEDSNIAGGSSVYSDSESVVLSFANIIESYWRQTELYEQSKDRLDIAEDELANMKQYLSEVLREVSSMKNRGFIKEKEKRGKGTK